jgi:hypothetical protein
MTVAAPAPHPGRHDCRQFAGGNIAQSFTEKSFRGHTNLTPHGRASC